MLGMGYVKHSLETLPIAGEMEGCMGVRMSGTIAHLGGDWTLSGVAENIDSMVLSLNQMESKGEKKFLINCEKIEDADTSGLQLLNVWVECARLRGIEPKLVHVTDGMLRAINELGFCHLFSDVYTDMPC